MNVSADTLRKLVRDASTEEWAQADELQAERGHTWADAFLISRAPELAWLAADFWEHITSYPAVDQADVDARFAFFHRLVALQKDNEHGL